MRTGADGEPTIGASAMESVTRGGARCDSIAACARVSARSASFICSTRAARMAASSRALPGALKNERLHEIAAADGDAVDRREHLVRLHGVRRRGRRRTQQKDEPEQGYGVTQPRGQPASAFEYSGCTQAPPVC